MNEAGFRLDSFTPCLLGRDVVGVNIKQLLYLRAAALAGQELTKVILQLPGSRNEKPDTLGHSSHPTFLSGPSHYPKAPDTSLITGDGWILFPRSGDLGFIGEVIPSLLRH